MSLKRKPSKVEGKKRYVRIEEGMLFNLMQAQSDTRTLGTLFGEGAREKNSLLLKTLQDGLQAGLSAEDLAAQVQALLETNRLKLLAQEPSPKAREAAKTWAVRYPFEDVWGGVWKSVYDAS